MSDRKTKVLHFSPHAQDDGIAKYQEQYIAGMADDKSIENVFFEVTPIQLRAMTAIEHQKAYDQLREQLHDFDIMHIQHEFGLYVEDDFQRLVDIAKDAGKKVVITVHLSPNYAIKPVKLGGVGPRSVVSFMKQKRHRNRMLERHITPFIQADLLIVHNDITRDALVGAGVQADKIKKITHPVYKFPDPPKSDLIAKKLNKKSGDIIYCTVGMIHKHKGIVEAVRALKFLPGNYKLAILGGLHPVETILVSDTVKIYNDITDLVDQLGLHDRVYIAGFVKDDNALNAYIRECDVCVYPYDGVYYANTSSGAINLGFSNGKPVIAYPTKGFVELATGADDAIVLTETFAYYELAREIERIDLTKQIKHSRAYADKMAWPKVSKVLAKAYVRLTEN